MVSENRIVNMSQSGSYTSVQWRGDWELFKREMLAAGTLSVLKPALKLSEEVAAQSHEKLEICHEAEMTQLSERLAAILILALGSTMGPQQSIVVNREAGKKKPILHRIRSAKKGAQTRFCGEVPCEPLD